MHGRDQRPRARGGGADGPAGRRASTAGSISWSTTPPATSTRPTAGLSANAWRAVVETDLYGTFYCCQAVYPVMKAQGGGRIVSISMTLHYRGWPLMAHATAAKAGVDALTRTLALEWAADRITVNAVAPGPIPTEGVKQAFTPPGGARERARDGRVRDARDPARPVGNAGGRRPPGHVPRQSGRRVDHGGDLRGGWWVLARRADGHEETAMFLGHFGVAFALKRARTQAVARYAVPRGAAAPTSSGARSCCAAGRRSASTPASPP